MFFKQETGFLAKYQGFVIAEIRNAASKNLIEIPDFKAGGAKENRRRCFKHLRRPGYQIAQSIRTACSKINAGRLAEINGVADAEVDAEINARVCRQHFEVIGGLYGNREFAFVEVKSR
jgi:hypothetical protein